jgi:integrase
MRKGKILGLTWDQVSLKDRWISVPPAKRGRPIHVPVNDELLAELRRLPRRLGSDAYVFVNPETDTRYVDVKKAWTAALRTAKITHFRFHDLRHTAATYLQAETRDLLVTQQILGHADIRTTTKYAHVSDDRLRQAVFGLQTAMARSEVAPGVAPASGA